MADSQVPWGVEALDGAVTEPAWKSKPSWYLVATDDRMIPPPAQRAMAKRAGATVVEAPAATPSTSRSRRRRRADPRGPRAADTGRPRGRFCPSVSALRDQLQPVFVPQSRHV